MVDNFQYLLIFRLASGSLARIFLSIEKEPTMAELPRA